MDPQYRTGITDPGWSSGVDRRAMLAQAQPLVVPPGDQMRSALGVPDKAAMLAQAPPPAQQYQTTAYQAPPATPQYQEGQTGIQFGGGAFQWTQHADGTWGYKAPDGREFDSGGNARATPSAANGWVGRTSEQAGFAPGQVWNGQSWVPADQQRSAQGQPSSGAAYTQTGPAGLQAAANPLVDFFKTNSGINVNAYNFGKLKSSTQDLVLGAAEAAGHDRGDVLQDIQRTLPRATGPRSGYVAPLGSR